MGIVSYAAVLCLVTQRSFPQLVGLTWARRDMEFLFVCSILYLSSECSERVIHGVKHEKTNSTTWNSTTLQPCIIFFIKQTSYLQEEDGLNYVSKWRLVERVAHQQLIGPLKHT